MNYKILSVVLVLLLFSTTPAFAHKLFAVYDKNTTFETATFFPDPFNDSYFTLEEFSREGESHWYSFVGSNGQEIFIQTLIPDIASSGDFTPCFDLIIGQGKVSPKVMKEVFIEEFSNTEWIVTCELTLTLPSDGLYYIRVHDELNHFNVGDTGKFSMAVGTQENFTLFDWIQTPIWYLQIHVFFENFYLVWFLIVMAIVISAWFIIALDKKS